MARIQTRGAQDCATWKVHAIFVLLAVVPFACSTQDDGPEAEPNVRAAAVLSADEVVLFETLRFPGEGGAERLVAPGVYRVEQHGGSTLRISARPSGRVLLLAASRSRHEEALPSPLARVLRSGPARCLVLWKPDGRQLRAEGFPVGTRARGGSPGTPERPWPATTLAVAKPCYRDVWAAGGEGRIGWSTVDIQSPSVSIALFTETGEFVSTLAAATDNDGSLVWTDVVAVPGRYLVYVEHDSARGFSDVFTIARPEPPAEPDPCK